MTPENVSSERVRDDRSVFMILLGLYFLVLFPILRANRYYNDDLKRALFGRTGWDSNGRPLTTLLMKLLQCYDSVLVDISPLTQIGAVVILAWSGVLIARRYAISSPWMAALVTFPLGGQPFYLENLSFKFDSLSMSVAMLLALLPIVSLKNDRRDWWLGILALFASLNFYQPAIHVYLVFILLDVVVAQLDGTTPRRLVQQFMSRLLQTIVAMLVYQLVVGIHINGWVKQKSEKIHSLQQLSLLKTNFLDFCSFVGNNFNGQWRIYFVPVLIAIALFPIVIGIRYAREARLTQPFWIIAILYVCSFLLPVAAVVCVFGPMLVLLEPPLIPRVLLGIGALLCAGLIVMQAALRQWRYSPKWTLSLGCMLALGMSVIASIYGNAAGEQKNYEDRIGARLADDIAELDPNHSPHVILLDGSAGRSPLTAHVAEHFPLINELIPPYVDAGETFHHIFLLYYMPEFTDMRVKPDARTSDLASMLLEKACHVSPTRTTNSYRLYMVDGTMIVAFGNSHSQRCDTGNFSIDAFGENDPLKKASAGTLD